jgi:serine protease Do
MTTRMTQVMTAIAAVLVTALPAQGQVAQAQSAARPRAALALTEMSASLEAAVRQVEPAVVEIFTTSYAPADGLVPRTADLVTTQRSSGSGVIVDPEGYVVTNAHVVRGANRLRVELVTPGAGASVLAARSRTVAAEVVGLDLETDLAVLRIAARDLPVLPFADSDELKAGQMVMAFGSPMGFRNSVSLGIVSSVARQLEPDSPMIYVQTDAAINPGSSGGPLVDLRGRLVGLNTLIISKAGGSEGLGFAAPSNIVRTVYEQIRAHGRVRRGDIGIRTQTVTPELAAGLGLPRETGAIVADVIPGSTASRAGLESGDLIASVNGKPMENGRQVQVALYRRLAGDVVALEIVRDGRTVRANVMALERRDGLEGLAGGVDARQHLVPRLGIVGVDLDRRVAQFLPVARAGSGVVVASTVDGAVDAREGGLAQGDIVTAVNRTRVSGLAELRAAVDALKPGDPIALQLERHGSLMYLAFTVE